MKKILLLLTASVFFACQTGKDAALLESAAFSEQIAQADVQVLDVRTPAEFAEGHLPNAINIDIESAGFNEATRILYPDLPVYVYCKSGKRSQTAGSRLKELGFKKVYELKGGITAWADNKLPVVISEPPVVYANDTIPFEEAVKGNKLVLVDFNATWCKPCKILQPTIDKIHRERTEDVIVYSIDVDDNPELARKYEASSIPLIMMFKNDQVLHRSMGVMSEEELNSIIDKNK